ncbi:hypothetical protein BaRGS_00030628 [Batillaria attramentaria]|uniref:Uncharacterized protein n=1 Tax=Batillaria attramentaria TaxID=370345 RepID=A0ABD0JUA5_9CAEN
MLGKVGCDNTTHNLKVKPEEFEVYVKEGWQLAGEKLKKLKVEPEDDKSRHWHRKTQTDYEEHTQLFLEPARVVIVVFFALCQL